MPISADWWIWLGVGVLIFAWLLFNIGCWLCHAYLNRKPPYMPCLLLAVSYVAISVDADLPNGA